MQGMKRVIEVPEVSVFYFSCVKYPLEAELCDMFEVSMALAATNDDFPSQWRESPRWNLQMCCVVWPAVQKSETIALI